MKKELSWRIIVIVVAVAVFLFALWFVVLKSDDAKKNIATASAIQFNKAYLGAIIYTSVGAIEIRFLQKNAPAAIYNFINLIENKFYNDTKFHYVLKDVLIQGGDPLSRGDDKSLYGTGGPGYTLPDEWSTEPMKRGIVAMANFGKDTSGSQFLILTAPEAKALNGKFTVFAKVINGFDTLDQINDVPTDNNIPRYPIVIDHIEVE